MEALRIIGDEHRNLWRIAAALDQLCGEMDAGGAPDRPLFLAIFDYLDEFFLQLHHPKEDRFLFPLLRQRRPAVAGLLHRLQAEHRDEPAAHRELRALLGAADACPGAGFSAALRGYAEGLRAHILAEERDVLPLARDAFTTADWAAIDAAFTDHEDPLFGDRVQERFRDAFHRIALLAPASVGFGGHLAEPAAAARAKPRPVLAVRGLESGYGRIKALKGVDLEIFPGELVALVGANGAGKSTLLRAISGVQPVSAGSVAFDNEDITRLRADLRMKRGICHVPEGRQVFGPLSVEDNLRLGAYTRPAGQAENDLERIWDLFPVLAEKRRLPAGTLSGGQQQLLAMGRALMGHPKLLLLDEPSMGLAPLLVEEVFNVIRSLKAQGITIFLVEQNAYSALEIADRGYVMEVGKIALTGRGADLLANDEVKAAYLGM